MPETISTPTRMSGGELESPQRDTFLALRRLIEQEPDVFRVLALESFDATDPDSRWLYLIETPFASFPRYVIGTTDAGNEDPEILFQSGSEWAAREQWNPFLSSCA
jgi:hypothetical protein